MPASSSEADASFYRLVHSIAAPLIESDSMERRGERRHAFRVLQRIAPWDGNGFPDWSKFVEVICHDLTRSGFSFLFPRKPDFPTLVAEFGTRPNLLYVLAEVIHCQPVLQYPSGMVERTGREDGPAGDSHGRSGEAVAAMLVGCRFVDRLQPPHSPAAEQQLRTDR